MSRTTHDINLDHHGQLEWSRLSAAIGEEIGQYYADESITSVIRSLDERLTAISQGYNIVASRFTMNAAIMPTFAADAYVDPAVPGTMTRSYLAADAVLA
jgi:hypothetical protein